jgi:predicted lipoprotein with Yx(FWY)xxD motif
MGSTQRPTGRSKFGRRAIALASVALAGAGLGVTALPMAAGAAASPTVITVTHNKTWGQILTLSSGFTLYRLTADSKNKSTCTGACAKIWPPVLLAAGQKTPVGHGVSGLGMIARAGGTHQVTLDGIPLYRYVGDQKPGQVTGNVKDTFGQWWDVNPSHPTAIPTAAKSGTTGTSAGSGVAF